MFLFWEMHRCVRRYLFLFLFLEMLCYFGLALFTLGSTLLFFPVKKYEARKPAILILCMPVTWIYVSYALAMKPSKVNLSFLLYLVLVYVTISILKKFLIREKFFKILINCIRIFCDII